MEELVTQLNTVVADAQTALATAEALPTPVAGTPDPVVSACITALEAEGYTVTAPLDASASGDASTPSA